MRGNYLVQKVINLLIEQKILFGLSVILSTLLVVPLWQSQSLEIYDSPGHVGLVWYLKEFLWPKFSGWNPFFLGGWPQGIFYPSLFHWSAAALSFTFGIETSIKLIISLAILSTPFAAFYAARNTISEKRYWLPATFLILIFLTALPNFLGIGFRGLFQIGLIPNFVSTPIFLAFIGLLHSQFKKGKFLWASLIISVLILGHLVAAISAGIYLLIYSVVLRSKSELRVRSLVWLIVISALLTSFFWVPFLLYRSFISVSIHPTPLPLAINSIIGLVALVLLTLHLRSKNNEGAALSTFAFVLLLAAVLDRYIIDNAPGSGLFNILYPFHVYRFQPYAYLAIILSLASLKEAKLWLENKKIFSLFTINIILFAALLTYLILRNPALPGVKTTLTGQPKLWGRFIESFSFTEVSWLPYSIQTKLVLSDPESNPWANGLFTDSTLNGPHFESLRRSLRPEAHPSGEWVITETKFIDQRNIQHALDLFGIKYVLNLGEVGSGEEIGKWEIGDEEQTFVVEEVGEGKLVEVTKLNPIPVGRDFDKKVEEWWDKDGEWSTLPFEVKSGEEIENLDTKIIDPKTKIEIIEHNKDWTKVKLKIALEDPQPVLIKFSYFPWWSASSAGQELPIYRAAPNLMLVFANGEVDLEFKEPIWLKVLYLISLGTFLVVIGYLFRKR